MSTYTIGQVAERSGFTASALRYYEGIGLVEPSTRTEAGYRLYDERALARLAFIARAKQLGCSLEEIADLVDLWDGQRCGPVQHRLHRLVTDRIDDARRRIDELTTLTAQMREAAAQLAGPPVDGPCGPGCACLREPDAGAEAGSAAPVALTAEAELPVACTLGADDLAGRLDEWRAMSAAATGRARTADGGLRIAFGRSVDVAALARLVAAEQECCAFYSFAIVVDRDGTALVVHAPDGAEQMLDALFGAVTA